MPHRALNPDELGRKGEGRFEEICTDAKLVANRVTIDRKGWDFHVEWHQPAMATKYDDRDPTISARVQVKTVWEGTKSIKLRLSSAEAIAKDHRPAFVYVFIVDDALNYVGAHIIHIQDAFLEGLLRKLRQLRVEGRQPNSTLYLVPLSRFGEAIEPDGASFRRYVESCVTGTMLDYATTKQAALDRLGGGKGLTRIETSISIETDDPFSEASDFFLGRREAKVLDIAAFSSRFGIDIPNCELTGQTGAMRLVPEPSAQCTIQLRKAGGQVLRFRGDMFRAPWFAAAPFRRRILVRASAFDLTLDANFDPAGDATTMQMSLESGRYSEIKLPADEWSDVCLFYADVGTIGSTLEVQTDGTPLPIVSETVELDNQSEEQRANWRRLSDTCQEAGAILRHAGWKDWAVPVAAIFKARRKIRLLHAIIHSPSSIDGILFHRSETDWPLETWPDQMLYIDRLELDGEALAFAATMRLTVPNNNAPCTAEFSDVQRLERIGGSDESFWEFTDRVRTLAKIDSYYIAAGDE